MNLVKRIPDISFWQGLVDWNVMASKTDAVIIRAGQNTWEDSMFRTNYAAAKVRNLLRGVYWFYDDRVSPGDQLKALVETIGDDVPEMEIWVDWENTYNGAFGGLKNVVAFMQAIEKEYPACSVGMYTGYYWMTEHSSMLLNWSQYKYLKDKPLWLASYTSAEAVRIPVPWTEPTLWQFGTPAENWGQASAEIDMSYYNGTEQDFYSHYAGDTPPPETGEIMSRWYKVTASVLNIRNGPGASYTDVGDLLLGDIVEAMETIGGWHHISSIWRNSGLIDCPAVAWCSGAYTVETTDPTPQPEPTFPPEIGITINGVTKSYIVKP